MDIYSRLTDIVIVHIVYINESNPYTPLVSIKSIQNRYQLSQTRLYLTRRPPIPPTTHPFRTPKSSRAFSESLEIISGHLGAPRKNLGPSPCDDFETLRDGPRWPEMTLRLSEMARDDSAPPNHLGAISESLEIISGTASVREGGG
jgi:hypothetical protein